jgi:hypothetical protein
MSVILENYFDTCDIDDSDSPAVFSCLNFMGDTDKNYLYGDNVALCEYHYCMIIESRTTGKHDTLSCSGAIMRFGDDNYYFNPITPFIADFKKMKPMPPSAVELMSLEIDYYYAKDVRTRFNQEIETVKCTNDFKTCVTFDNSTLCFGNIRNQHIVHTPQALTWGTMSSLLIGAFTIFIVVPKMRTRAPWQVFVMYLLPIASVILIYFGLILSPKLPFAAGNFLVMWAFPLVFYTMRDVYRNSEEYIELSQKEKNDDGKKNNYF